MLKTLIIGNNGLSKQLIVMFEIDRVSKTFWFFLPIAISLFVNLVMFIVTSIELCRLDYHVRKRRQLQLQVKETRRQMLER